MKTHKCRQCSSGLVPGQIKTFDPDCAGCQHKLKDGLRTGDEPMPPPPGNQGKKRLSPEAWGAYVRRLKTGPS